MVELDYAHYRALMQDPSFVRKHSPQFLRDFGSVYRNNMHLAPFFKEFRAFADAPENPEANVLIGKGGMSVSANPACDTYDGALFSFLLSRYRENNNELCFSCMPGLEEKIEAMFSGYRIEHPIRREFRLNEASFRKLPNWRGRIPRGFSIAYYDIQSADFLKRHRRSDECWFPESKRFAFAALRRGKIVSECFSVFVDGGTAQVGVHTQKRFRRRGLAFLVSAAFIEHCLDHGLEARWGTDYGNTASAALAEKLGFELYSEDAGIRITSGI